jgi:Arc/MetJ-type ribon-helix-helix transcriptional regulator
MAGGILCGMNRQIAIRLPDEDLAVLDAEVAAGHFPSRAAAVRAGVHEFVSAQRSREIADAYKRAYGAVPQEAWFAEASAQAVGELLAERDTST